MGALSTAIHVLFMVSFAVNVSPVDGQTPFPRGDEVQANTYTTGDQRRPAVGSDGGNGFVVLWNSYDDSIYPTEYQGLQGRRFTQDGEAIGTQFRVGSEIAHRQKYSAISPDGSGGFVVVWTNSASTHPSSSRNDIHARRFSSDGAPIGDDFRVNSYTSSHQHYPDVALDGSGGFVVVWRSEGSSGTDSDEWSIQGQLFNSLGQPRGEQFQINTYTTRHQSFPKVSSVGSGGFVVVWQSSGSSGSDNNSRSVLGQRFNSDGFPLAGEFQVNTLSQGSQDNPDISPFGSGFVVVWNGPSPDPDADGDIRAKVFGSDGSQIGGEFRVNTSTTNRQQNPVVSSDGHGGFVVVWETWYAPNSNAYGMTLLGQRHDSMGQAVGEEFMIKNHTSHNQSMPEIGLIGNGDFVVTWRNTEILGNAQSYRTIRAQRFDLSHSAGEPFVCLEDAETFCLQGGRFEVKVHWRDFLDRAGKGQVVTGASDDSGLLWFFNDDNWEMLVKVLDGCSLNDRFWVFAAATTDVEYTMVVRDSFTGESAFYYNSLGTASPAITDSDAFATCP